MEEKNVWEHAHEFKRYSQYEKIRSECEAGNKELEDILWVLTLMHPSWMRRYNAKERV